MDKITVLYIIDAFVELAGAERNLYEVATRLDKDKFRPVVFSLISGRLTKALNEQGVIAKDLKLKRIYGFKALIEAVKLIYFIKKEKVKIVVTYHESSDFWGGIISKIAGVPVIISSRRDMGYRLRKRHIFMYGFVNEVFDRIITVSDAVKKSIFKIENALWSRLYTVYNGVDLDKFEKPTDTQIEQMKNLLGIAAGRQVVGIIAALRPIKGHRVFLEAASKILKTLPETYFLIVGWYDNKTKYFKELSDLTKSLGIENSVFFTAGRSDASDILSAIDVPVLSSRSEGFSNTILEYMAAGKPAVATRVGGNPEAIVDGETGVLVPPDDPTALADAILMLLKNKKMALDMGLAAKKRVEELFSMRAMIDNTENLYLDMLWKKGFGSKTDQY
jgi:L-malate glycosyltransferase